MKVSQIKIGALDAMRTISILAVLAIHTTTKTLETSHYDLKTYWPSLVLNQMARFAVPLFFLISGFALELNSKERIDVKSFIRKRVARIVIPYIVWSFFYYYFVYTQNTDNIFRVLAVGNASYQLYFIPAICIFYLLFPFLHRFYKLIANVPVLTVLIVLQVNLMNKDYLVRQFTFADPIRIFLLGYIFFLLGMVAARNLGSLLKFIKLTKIPLVFIAIYLSRQIYIEGFTRYYQTYNIGAFYSQWRPDILIYSVTLGLLFLYFFEKDNYFFSFIRRASKFGYFVFFVHVFILEIIWKAVGKSLFNNLPTTFYLIFGYEILLFCSVAFMSFLAAYLVSRIRPLKKLTG